MASQNIPSPLWSKARSLNTTNPNNSRVAGLVDNSENNPVTISAREVSDTCRKSRARLASFDDDTIPAEIIPRHSGEGGYEVAGFSDMASPNRDKSNDENHDKNNVNLTPSTQSFKHHADGVKDLKLKSPSSASGDGDYATSPCPGSSDGNIAVLLIDEQVPGETSMDSKYRVDVSVLTTTAANDNHDRDQNVWIAPFNDADDLDSSSEDGQGRVILTNEDVEKAVVEVEMATKEEAEKQHVAFMASLSPAQRLMDAAIKVQAVVKFTRMQRIKKRARWLTKKFIVFVLSHVGLTSLVGLYAVAGGFIFQHLEGNVGSPDPNALPIREKGGKHADPNAGEFIFQHFENNVKALEANDTIRATRLQVVEYLWNQTIELNILYQDEWSAKVEEGLKQFEKEIYKMIQEEQREHRLDYNPGQAADWTYPSALLFAVTVITTIGYGDITLQTPEAKVVCMFYAVIGIPLTLLCLANIGSFLATVYRFSWKHLHHLSLIIVRSPGRNKPLVATEDVRVPITVSVTTMVVYILGGAAIFSRWENWTFLEGSYFCFITLSTIGFGDYVPGQDTETLDHNAKRVVCALYLIFGLALLSMIFQLIQDSVTVVVRRYASFMGLSEAQIERDIQESEDDEEDVKEKYYVDAMGNSAMAKDGVIGEAYVRNGFEHLPQESEHLTSQNRFRKMVVDTGKLHRAGSFPTSKSENKTHLTVSRLYSVPEEELSRRGSNVKLDELKDSPEVTSGGVDMEVVRDVLCKKYSIPSNTAHEDQMMDKVGNAE